MAQTLSTLGGRTPTILTVPGLNGSGPAHWQTLWEQGRTDTIRADLGNLSAPRRNAWVTRLDQAIRTARAPVILAAHSLGCLAVAWWAALAGQTWGWPVAGALLVAPPDVDRARRVRRTARFRPVAARPAALPVDPGRQHGRSLRIHPA
jgi:predicted alpha/beta hydrolase family esterase